MFEAFGYPRLATITRYALVATRKKNSASPCCSWQSSWISAQPWELATGVIATARSKQHRDQPVDRMPWNHSIGGNFPHELYEVVGNVYELANAPHIFSLKVISAMTSLLAQSRPCPDDLPSAILWTTRSHRYLPCRVGGGRHFLCQCTW